MSTVRIALANLRVPATPDESVRLATSAVADASRRGAMVICFPECFVPGYFASVNCASEGSGLTSAIARPDGTLPKRSSPDAIGIDDPAGPVHPFEPVLSRKALDRCGAHG